MKRCSITHILLLILFVFNSHLHGSSPNQVRKLPKILYWAWEAPQELTTIDPAHSGIAELAASIYIKGDHPIYYLRRQPLRAPKNIYRMAVIHIEARARWKPVLDQHMAKKIAVEINTLYKKQPYNSLQIDFEVLNHQRDFYQTLLTEIRQLMGNDLLISITGLASWCTSDGWVGKAKLPVDLMVPMYFSISNEVHQRQAFISRFPSSITRLAPECRLAIGLATFEQWQIPLRANVPVFVFTKGSWNEKTLKQAEELASTIQQPQQGNS